MDNGAHMSGNLTFDLDLRGGVRAAVRAAATSDGARPEVILVAVNHLGLSSGVQVRLSLLRVGAPRVTLLAPDPSVRASHMHMHMHEPRPCACPCHVPRACHALHIDMPVLALC